MKELFEKISDERRERIIQAAIEEFAMNGYDNANTNKIAKRAAISIGSLFQYFDNKEDLFITIVKHCSNLIRGAFEEVISKEDTIFVTVEKILRKIIRESRENPNIIKLYFEMTSPSKSHLVEKVVQELEDYSHQIYYSMIQKGKDEGIVRKDCDPAIFSFLLDNLFMMLQFSYSCEYYQQRLSIYGGADILNQEDKIVEQSMKFIKAAFSA